MSCLLLTTPQVCSLSAGGVKKILLAPAADVGTLLFTDDNLNIVTGFQYQSFIAAFWIVLEPTRQQTKLTEAYSDENGPIYDVEISSNLVRIDEDKRGFFEELQSNPVAAVIQDYNDKFWIVGIDAPLRLTAYTAGTDPQGGISQYAFSLSGRSRFRMVELSTTAANGLFVLVEDCTIYAGFQISAVPGPIGQYYSCVINEFF